MTIENIDRVMSNLSYRPHTVIDIFMQPNHMIKKNRNTRGRKCSGLDFGTLQPPLPRKIGEGFNRVGSLPPPLPPRTY